jgi:hypothetical protein
MSKKIFEVESDSDIEVVDEPVKLDVIDEEDVLEEEVVQEKVKAPKVKKSKKLKVLDPEDDNTEKQVLDELEEPKKKRKKRPPLTEERKAQLLKNLEVGRKKAMENRKKKAQVKKIIKKKKEEEMDTLIKEDLVAKKFEASEKNKLREDLDEMKSMMKNLMEENKKLKSTPPIGNQSLGATPQSSQKISVEQNKKLVVENSQLKQESKPSSLPIPKVLKVHKSKGIASRWSKYNL